MSRQSNRKSRGLQKRKTNSRKEKKFFLIMCEGEKTEPNYFKKFECAPKHVEVCGDGYNTLSLVKKTIAKRNREKGLYREIWCVFDRDSFPAQDFNQALALAKRENIKVAYSNEAFELWYLLHFQYVTSGISRTEYERMLTNQLKKPYKKNDANMFELLFEKQDNAIQNAERLLGFYGEAHNPEQDNPSTTVHLLVKRLRDFDDASDAIR